KDGQYGVNLYRANIFKYVLAPRERYTTVPVQLLVPTNDHFMIEDIWDDLDQWVPNLTRSTIEAGHWLQLSHAQQFAQAASQFIEKHR
ncbi:MAG TPA: alpha/beta hydrolase, partial [Agitococcus sp.]|nr:alpha/beta hydrolase [Agitococcus sp.]